MSNHNLFTLSADGAVVPASSETILVAARQVLAHRVRRGASLQSPQKAGEYLTVRLGHLDYQVFGLILLDKRHWGGPVSTDDLEFVISDSDPPPQSIPHRAAQQCGLPRMQKARA